MKSILKNNSNEIIIKKSKFITYLFKVQSINEVNEYLNKIKLEYNDATHICYAYVVDNIQKYSDNNEPSGTAGVPILSIINKKQINNCLAIVIRYFGGIKLGANGLVRAYTNSITSCLDKNEIIELEKGYLIKITISYDKQKLLNNILKDSVVKEKVFEENLIYTIECNENILKELEFNSINYQIIKEVYIKKTDK